MEITWTDVIRFLKPGLAVRHIGLHGYTGFRFEVTGVTSTKLSLITHEGKNLDVTANDFGKTYPLYDDYLSGKAKTCSIRKISGRPVYIFAIVHAFRSGGIKQEIEFRSILQPDSRIYVKSDFAPVSADWPGVSFSGAGIANRLAEEFNSESDFLITVGTMDPENTTEPEHRGACLSVMRLSDQGPIPSALLIAAEQLARYQSSGQERFQFSLEPAEVWSVRDFVSAKLLFPATYKTIGLFRDSYTQLSPQEI